MKFKNKNIVFFSLITAAICIFSYSDAFSLTFNTPSGDVIGEVKTVVSKDGDTLAQIARDADMGYMEMREANPGLDPDHIPAGSVVVVPSQFILPNTPRNGIVINLAEMRLYYYPQGTGKVVTYPIGIGREGEGTPVGVMQIIQHIPNPTWIATDTMRKLRAAEGVELPKFVPPGPENPLGNYAMRLSRPTFLIHGTNEPLGGIGRRSSSGCMRLYPEDIDPLFHSVPNGANVYIIDEPYKVGWSQNQLYIESHVALQEDGDKAIDDTVQIRNLVELAAKGRNVNVDWNKALTISHEEQGLPQVIGHAG